MDKKIKIDIAEFIYIKRRIAEINSVPFENIVFTDGQDEIQISSEMVEDFLRTGLRNIDFIFVEFNEEEAEA